jgi:1-deoxy-D-xylulose-5-phosphate reductoisomerase
VALLGSGGSIGRQAVDVLARNAGAFRVVALATGSQGRVLEEQARLLEPLAVSLADERAAARLDLPAGTEIVGGEDALERLATRPDVDLVIVATGGLVALRSVLAALEAGKVVATATWSCRSSDVSQPGPPPRRATTITHLPVRSAGCDPSTRNIPPSGSV